MCSFQERLRTSLKRYSKNVSVEYLGQEITFEQLDKDSNRVANYLKTQGVQKGSHIGILTEDKYKNIYCMLGIIKAESVFVNLDYEYTKERLKTMVQSSDTKEIFVDNEYQASELFDTTDVKLWNLNEITGSEEDIAQVNYEKEAPIYMYFTSGTTGKPKVIVGKNESLLHFIEWEIKEFELSEGLKAAQFTSQCHDPYLRDIFVPILCGGTICIPSSKDVMLSSVHLGNWIESSKINLIHCTLSFFKIIRSCTLSDNSFHSLKYILLAGERVNSKDLKEWYECFDERIQLVNLYGPTETTLAKTFYRIKREDIEKNMIPIGKPIDGCKIAVISNDNNLCANGEIGEIIIRTPYRTLGYYKDEKANKEKFVKNPFGNSDEDIVYKTGDIGRMLPDGNFEIIGRKDRQIKIRGYRVEPEDCESCIINYPEIKDCAVVYKRKKGLEEVSTCIKCGIPSDYPSTKIDVNGVCNYCNFYDEVKEKSQAYFKTLDDLKQKFEQLKSNESEYDCLFLYSGGKDSTYALSKLVEMNLKVLAFTFDNGFISDKALSNIKKVVEYLHVDHVYYSYDDMKKIFVAGLDEESSVCNGCFKVLRILSTKLAHEKHIKSIVTGFSRGQIYDLRLYSIYKQGIFDLDEIEEKIYEQRVLYHSKQDYVLTRMKPDERVTPEMLREVELIDFYRYTPVKNVEILDYILKNIEVWTSPKDTGMCSSNCLINDLGIYVQQERFKYDNYTFPRSWEVRVNHITLDAAHKEAEAKIDTARLEEIMNKLNYHKDIKENNYEEGKIVAYYVSDKELEQKEIEKYAASYLPKYMIPQEFIQLDELPITSNGKKDYRALEIRKDSAVENYIAPRDEVEKKLEAIWCNVLGRDKVSIRDSFIKLGGSSLNIMTLISEIYSEFEVDIQIAELFNGLNIEKIAEKIKEESGIEEETVVQEAATTKEEYYAVSNSQKRMYALNLMKNVGTSYNIPFSLILDGPVDIKKLEEVFGKLVQRHESLRTSFHIVNNVIVQKIHDDVEFKINLLEFPEEDLEERIPDLVQPFDLSQKTLFRVTLVKLKENRYFMLFDIHHIIADGASMGVIVEELRKLYEGQQLPELKVQYKDFCMWQQSDEYKDIIDKQEKYWLEKFTDSISVAELPLDEKISKKDSFKGDNYEFCIDAQTRGKLMEIVEEQKSTLFTMLLSAYYILIEKYAKTNTITVGIPVLGRSNTRFNNQVGVFVNTLPIKSTVVENESFKLFLSRVNNILNEVYQNQDYPLDTLNAKLGVSPMKKVKSLFNTLFVMNQKIGQITEIGNVKVEKYNFKNKIAKFPISLYVEEDGKIECYFEYNTVGYKYETIQKFAAEYIQILEKVAINSEIVVSELLEK